jgi:thiol:disulfide interchange protein DsbA
MKFTQVILASLAIALASCSSEEPVSASQAARPAAAPKSDASAPAASEQQEPIRLAQADSAPDSATGSATPAASPRTDWQFSEGKHYQRLNTAQGTSGPPDTIEVAEVFWYGCDACRRFEPLLASWTESLASDVRFVRIPVIWDNPAYKFHARIFYTAEALGILERTHTDTFNAIIDRRAIASEEDAQDFFESYGVSAEDFKKHFRSFAVESKLGKGAQLVRRYRVTSTPTMVVNGKYVATGPEVRSWGMILDIVSELVEKERQR